MKRSAVVLFVLIRTVNSACMKQKTQLAAGNGGTDPVCRYKKQVISTVAEPIWSFANSGKGTNAGTGNGFLIVNHNQHSGNCCVS
ncbi:hypothetical protein SAMN04487894_107165 [Niabella drilacis]|uniref:Uncharacterized protein n=1 Tax=Niabella drilacis (strain DSM 25811 / CCM 8410 / CCUG 62505 / LMG 26954 / E90) TaxID=1285928 RepID=A0A1G6TE28_NIADE|nr:hypothetical protein SAMN04487894_107165 [Niabella drilacis]